MDVNNWEHKSGYHLNADGKSIEYTHTEKPLLAIVEGMVNEDPNTIDFQYYTVVFDTSNGKPYTRVKGHNFFSDKQEAKFILEHWMQELS
jgi:hypothetical protein